MEIVHSRSGSHSAWRWIVFAALSFLLGLAAVLPLATTGSRERRFYFFEVELTASSPGLTQLFFDVGRGINEADSSVQPLKEVHRPTRYRYLIPVGAVSSLRFDFNNNPGNYTFAHARIRSLAGKTLYEFSPVDFHADHEVQKLSSHDSTIEVTTEENAHDPYIYLRPNRTIELPYGWREALITGRTRFALLFIALLAGGVALEFGTAKIRPLLVSIGQAAQRRPKSTLALLAALSVAWQVHPVIFSGKSFASPNAPAFLLYDSFPTLPGYTSAQYEDQKGSDVAAFLYSHVHFPALERRALLRDHELPLWNRYDLAGTPLLGQGQSMFGEVLNFIPLLGNSSAWTWDLKFILARWIFAFALGLFVWKATDHLAAANIIALTASWIGFFAFRQTHPAQFAVCFGPLVLLAWAWLEESKTRRTLVGAAAALVFANWEMMTSGTIKEAYMTLLCLNFAGLLYLLARSAPWRTTRLKIVVAATAGLILILLTAPFWWVFLDTLKVSSTNYDTPLASQIEAWQLIGLFEDLFYRHLNPAEIHGNPSTNLLVLLGTVWLVANLLFTRNRVGWALCLGALLPASFAFGLVPASWIVRTPFLANIYHVGNTFSCPLIVMLIAVSGVGFANLFRQLATGISVRTAVAAGALLIGLVLIYARHAWGVPMSPFFIGYIYSLLMVVIALGLALGMRRYLSFPLISLIVGAAFAGLLWRHGQYNHIAFDEYVYNPQVRTDLHAPSAAITKIASLEDEPARIAGFDLMLYNGANQLYFQEGIYGVEAVRVGDYDELALAADLPKTRIWGGTRFGGERGPSRGTMDMLNVRYYLDRVQPLRASFGLKLIGTEDLQILESPTVWPRAFYTNNLIEEGTVAQLAQSLNSSRGVPFAAISEQDGPKLDQLNVYRPANTDIINAAAHNYTLTANTTSFTVDAPGPGLIVLTEAYYPNDFRAFLNDKPVEYLRVNHAFKAVAVSAAGTYNVRFEYWPHHLTAALSLSVIGLGVSALFLVTSMKKIRMGAPI